MNIIVPCKNLNETAVSAGILPFSGLHALKVFNGAFTSYHKLCQALRFMVKKRFSGKTAIYILSSFKIVLMFKSTTETDCSRCTLERN